MKLLVLYNPKLGLDTCPRVNNQPFQPLVTTRVNLTSSGLVTIMTIDHIPSIIQFI